MNNLKKYLILTEITQRKLSKLVRISPSRLNRILNDEQKPTFEEKIRIVMALNGLLKKQDFQTVSVKHVFPDTFKNFSTANIVETIFGKRQFAVRGHGRRAA
jgi:transcriptional regulator with XRE-family HTH domain